MMLRDPVHGLVSFEAEEATIVPQLLDTPELQRLRGIRQLGLTSMVYPGADHTRFAHGIGAAHVMQRFVSRLREEHEELPFWQRLTTERARDALAAALLHDLGHGPFSHLFEAALPRAPHHEEWTKRLILDPGTQINQVLVAADPAMPARVAELVRGEHELTFLAGTVSGTFDVDRCDYLLRDAHFTGVSYGNYDLDWLLRSLRFGLPRPDEAPALAIDGTRGLPAIESFILARLFMFQQVYFHKASRASEFMLGQLLGRVRELVVDGTRLPGAPQGLMALARDDDCSIGEYLELDDARLWTCIAGWRDGPDPLLADLCSRLWRRRLFKTYDLYGDFAQPDAQRELLNKARDLARAQGLDDSRYVGLDRASYMPFEERRGSLSVVMPDGTEQWPGDVSFLLGRLRGEHLQRSRLVFAPELRDGIFDLVRN